MRVLSFDNTKSSMSAIDLVEDISKKVPASVQIEILKETRNTQKRKIRGFLGTLTYE